VGLIVHEVTDPYFAAIAAGAMHAAHAEDVMVLMAATFRDPELEIDYLSRLRAQGARGVLLAGSGSTDPRVSARLAEAIAAFTRDGGRVAAVGARPDAAVDAVVPANAEGARAALAHLRELGHRRIGVVAGPPTLRTVRERLDGLGLGDGDGTDSAGSTDSADGGSLRVEGADFTREGGYAAARRLLALDGAAAAADNTATDPVGDAVADAGRTKPAPAPVPAGTAIHAITAIIALNDLMAAGVLAAARDAGREVPYDLSVIGFDDLPFAADLAPALSTVRLPLRQMGERAMELLLADEDPTAEPRTVPVPAELVVRASTAAAPTSVPRPPTSG
jgi:LacI family transcriptional regulator